MHTPNPSIQSGWAGSVVPLGASRRPARGAEPSYTDTMHLILATNPFVLLSMAFGVAAFRGWFRLYTTATILILLLSPVFAFLYAPELQANRPTPGLGLGERLAQYAYELWQAALAIVLLREQRLQS